MKQIIIALVLAFTTCALVNAQNQTTVINDSIGKVKITVTKHNKEAKANKEANANTNKDANANKDAKANAKADPKNTAVTVIGVDTADTDSTNLDSANYSTSSISIDANDDDFPFDNFEKAVGGGIVVAIVSIVFIFGMPIFILAIIFFFRYKNRKARYRLAEQALAAGQPLPTDFLRENRPTDQRSQGIKNTFTGIGLFIFLWAITGELGIGSIGLLVMFMGIGQWIIGNKQEQQKKLEKELQKEQQPQPTTYTTRAKSKVQESAEESIVESAKAENEAENEEKSEENK